MRDRLRVGAGQVGAVHASAARRSGAVVTRVAGSTAESSREGGQRLGAQVTTLSARELIEAPDVDIVHVCRPNRTHARLAAAVIEAGKHVICEKPLAVDRTEADLLGILAERSGLVATVPFVYRYYPTVRQARSLAHDGRLGRVHLMHGSYLQDWLSSPDSDNWRVDPELAGPSRTFADIGVHWCDLGRSSPATASPNSTLVSPWCVPSAADVSSVPRTPPS